MSTEEKIVKLRIMDRTGDSVLELPVSEAIDRAKEEMGRGKWLRIVNEGGKSDTITDPADPQLEDLDVARGIFENALELGLVAGLVGG